MRQVIIFLLAAACVLSYFGVVQADCCRTYLWLKYQIKDGYCADVGGRRGDSGDDCQVYICADGSVQKYWCGVGDCDVLGCRCDDGCRKGNWKSSFLAKYPNKRIIVTDEIWLPYL